MYEPKKILVIGAAGLLGISVTKELLMRGNTVIASDLDCKMIAGGLADLEYYQENKMLNMESLNITSEKSLSNVFSKYADISGVVNCSYPKNQNYGREFFKVDVHDFNENISLNLGSSFLLMKQCAAHFKNYPKNFSLVNIGSIYGVVAPRFDIYKDTEMTMPVEYAAIKSALIHLSKYVVKYVKDSRFRINTVSLGGLIDKQDTKFLENYKEYTLGKGMLENSDAIGAICFLLSDESLYINGQNIIVDDGFTL